MDDLHHHEFPAQDEAIPPSITVPSSYKTPLRKAREFWHILGPGLTTGAADDDPSGIATYSQAGAKFGFQYLWLALFTFPFMAVVQEMCARIGMVTGRGLAGNIRRHFPRSVLYVCTALLFFANTFNLGVDLGAMASATKMLAPSVPFGVLLIAFTLLCLLLQVFISYKKYAQYLKWLAVVLLSYVFSTLMIELDWKEVLRHAVIPSLSFSKEHLLLITGMLGTTISPYLFFWQTSQEVEEEILQGKTSIASRVGATDKEIKNMRVDIWSGMGISNLVMFFIIAACAATLHASGITSITSAAQAAEALRPLAGERAALLFTLGIVGAGLLAVPVLAGAASYALAESFGWKYGLYRKWKKALAFYGVIALSMAIGFVVNFVGLDPIAALIAAAVVNGLIAPVVLILIVKIASNNKIMGARVNGRFTTGLGFLVVGIMALAGIATIVSIMVH